MDTAAPQDMKAKEAAPGPGVGASEADRAIGITDLLAHRECPRRASYGLRRHIGGESHEQDPWMRTPEAGSRAAAFGSAVHDAIAALEDGHDDASAIQVGWERWGRWLEPADLALLHDDIAKFHARDFPGTRSVLVEDEIRVPVTLLDGTLATFRARIDRLYERLDAPGQFIHVDYKSSRWAKSESEVRADLQMWGYNWALHEYLPEIDSLLQIYDQLRYGQVPIRKTDAQREQMRMWIVAEMSAYFADTDYQADGLLAPRYNQWCPWCPLLESCPIVDELSDFALARIGAIRGEDLTGADDLARFSELYSTSKGAMKVLKRFGESMSALARELPASERERLGFSVSDRRNMTFSTAALEQLQARLGEQFLELVSVPKTHLETLDPDLRDWALSLMEPAAPTQVVARKEPARR